MYMYPATPRSYHPTLYLIGTQAALAPPRVAILPPHESNRLLYRIRLPLRCRRDSFARTTLGTANDEATTRGSASGLSPPMHRAMHSFTSRPCPKLPRPPQWALKI